MSVSKSNIALLAVILLGSNPTFLTEAVAEQSNLDVKEFHQILDAVKKSEIPEQVKAQLLRDMLTTLIKSVETADIPEHTKQTLIRDLESTTSR